MARYSSSAISMWTLHNPGQPEEIARACPRRQASRQGKLHRQACPWPQTGWQNKEWSAPGRKVVGTLDGFTSG